MLKERRGECLSPPSGSNFEEDLQHDWHAEWKARNAEKSPSVAMYATSLTTLVTLSSEPKWFLAAESTFRAAIRAASRPSSTSYSLPSRPTNFGLCPMSGRMPLR